MTILFVLTVLWSNLKTSKKGVVETLESLEWPEHWRAILQHAEQLQLVLLDGTALKCVFNNTREACNNLYSNPEARFGTMMQDFEEFYASLNETIIKARRDCF